MNSLTETLARICSDRRIDAKYLIAPSIRAGRQWLDAVTGTGAPVVNVHIKTFDAFAIQLASPEMGQRGLKFLSELRGILTVAKVIDGLPHKVGGFLAALRPTMGLYRRLFASIQDLRLADIDPAGIDAHALEPAGKGEELSIIFRAFLNEQAERNLVDYAGVLKLAKAKFEGDDPLSQDVLILLPEDLELTAAELTLLEKIPSRRILKLPVDKPGQAQEGQPESGGDVGRLRWILDPFTAPAPQEPDGTVRFFRAAGEVNEIRHILRLCLQQGVSFDKVEILHTDYGAYVPLIYELTETMRLTAPGNGEPFVTFEEGLPASFSRPGKALAAWVAWHRDDFPQAILVNLLAEGLVTPPQVDGRPVLAQSVLKVLRTLKIGFGVARWRRAFDEVSCATPAHEGDQADALLDEDDHARPGVQFTKEYARATQALSQLVQGLFDISLSVDDDPSRLLMRAVTFLDKFACKTNELDNYAAAALKDRIHEALASLDHHSKFLCALLQDWLERLPDEVRVMGSLPLPGRIHVSNIYSGGQSLRPHTFIVGLDDGRFPGGESQDPLILDKERRALSSKLRTSVERLDSRMSAFARLLARIRGAVTLSYSCVKIADDCEMFPGPAIIAAHRVLSGRVEVDPKELDRRLGPPVSFFPETPEACATLTDLRISSTCGVYLYGGSGPDFAARFPHLVRGALARERRSSKEFTEHDGRILTPGADLSPYSPYGPVMSSSSLETLGRCPFAYFLRYVLELAPHREVDISEWLDAGAFGSLLHEVLCDFIGRAMDADSWPPVSEHDREDMMNKAEIRLNEWKRREPSPNEGAVLRRERELRRALKIFLTEEAGSGEGRRPWCAEACVGMKQDARRTPLDSPDPVSIPLPNGEIIRARGKIDRVDIFDAGDEGRFAVIDYKSGRAAKFSSDDPFSSGRTVQHGIYTLIAREALRKSVGDHARVVETMFFFPNVKEYGLRISYNERDMAAFPAVLQTLCHIAASGAFLPTDDHEADCRFCDYRAICGDVREVSAWSVGKLENTANHLLKPIKELRTHE